MSDSHPHNTHDDCESACQSLRGIPVPHSLLFKASAIVSPLVALSILMRLGF